MKRLSLLLFVMTLIASLALSGCSNSDDSGGESGTKTVSMIYWPGPESDAMKEVVSAYNKGQGKKDGVKVDMVLISRGGTYAKEATMMSSKSDDVDMYFTASYIIGQHAPYLDALNGKVKTDNYLDSSIKSLQYDGKTLAIPMDISNNFLLYRKDLIDKLLNNNDWKEKYKDISKKIVGKELTPKDPKDWNWDDFVATAAFFTKKYNSNVPTKYGTALQLKNLIFNVMIWDDLLWSNGGKWLDDNGQPAFTSQPAKDAMKIYSTIYKKGLTSPNSTVAEFPETQASLKTGDAAFAIQWSAAYSELNDPDKSPKTAGKIGIAPIPEGETHIHSLAVGLNKYSKNKKAALKWMNYLTTNDAMDIYAENGGIPPIESVLNDMGKEKPALPIMAEHIKKYGFSEPTLPETQKILETLAKDLSPAWVGEKDINSALEKAQDDVSQILSK